MARTWSVSQQRFIDSPMPSAQGISGMTSGTETGGVNPLNLLFASLIAKNPKQTTALSAMHGLLKPKEKSEAEKESDKKKSDAERMLTQLENMYFKKKLHYGNSPKGIYAETLAPMIDPDADYVRWKKLLDSERPMLAKLAGDTGNLALQEQIQAGAPFPTARYDKKSAAESFADIRTKFGLPERTYEKLDSYAPSGLEDIGSKYGL